MFRKFSLLVVLLSLMVLLPTTAALAGNGAGISETAFAHCASAPFIQAKFGGYSGDDIYDMAADLGERSNPASLQIPCQDAVVSALSTRFGSGGSFSGDDLYDFAAGFSDELNRDGSIASPAGFVNNFSGDDYYDGAALLNIEQFNQDTSETLNSSGVSFSGDDAYDQSAGGTP